jgi:hypothetical protein
MANMVRDGNMAELDASAHYSRLRNPDKRDPLMLLS